MKQEAHTFQGPFHRSGITHIAGDDFAIEPFQIGAGGRGADQHTNIITALDRKARNRRTDKARRTGDENPIRHRDQAAAGLRMNLRASCTMRGTKLGRSRRES